MKRTELARIAAVSLLAVFTLSGCDTWRSAVNYVGSSDANTCPDAAILANTSVLPAFDPAKGSDPSNVQYTATLTNVVTRCDYRKRQNTADASLHISYTVRRAPGGEEAHYRVPYYVAVTSGAEIVDKQMLWLEIEFPKSLASVSGEVMVPSVDIKVARQKRPYEYHLLVGWQLTQAQIEYNKKMGQYLP